MLTIGQLARHVGVTTKTIRVYHAKRLLPEPERDSAGYRRYTARDAVALIKIRTLAEAGVSLARIRTLDARNFADELDQIDRDLTARIAKLRAIQKRLRNLDASHRHLIPPAVANAIDAMTRHGFSTRWTKLQTDLWILAFATQPELARRHFADQRAAYADPALRRIFLAYDRAFDLHPDDPKLARLATRIVLETKRRYRTLPRISGELPSLVQATVNAASPAWRHLDTLVRAQLSDSK